MGKYFLLTLGIVSLVCFFSPQKVRAEDSDVVISEVMADIAPTDSCEWVELYNNGTLLVNLTGWTIDGKIIGDSVSIKPKDYLVITKNITDFNKIWDVDSDKLVQVPIVLTNSGKTLILRKTPGAYEEIFDYAKATPNFSWEKIDLDKGDKSDNWGLSDFGGTPGKENSFPKILPSPSPSPTPSPSPSPLTPPLAPTDLKVTSQGKSTTFSWSNPDPQALTFEVVVTNFVSDVGDDVVDHEPPTDLLKLEYKTDLDWGKYTWRVIASNGNLADDALTPGSDFELIQPIYSKDVIVNELSPHPSDGVNNEFIELYNIGTEPVNVYGWFLDDIEGGSTPYQIPTKDSITDDEYWIESGDYLVFYKTVTKLSLNDSGDSGRLLFPDKSLASIATYTEIAPLDLAWARGADSTWAWTEKVTPNKANIIYLTPETDSLSKSESDTVTEDTVINSEPIKIKSNDFRDFGEKLVAVEGTVISTSGNTFFLDDGSGPAKIYIQDKTGINKPPMHKGDTFSIIGLVDLYRAVWRILPQKQSDVKLIHCVKDDKIAPTKITKSSSALSSSKESSVGDNATNQARAPTVSDSIIKQVKAADISASLPNSINQTQAKSSIWGQMAKALTSTALIFMVLLTLKVKRIPKVKVIGGHFGEDDT